MMSAMEDVIERKTGKRWLGRLQRPGKQMFWAWIAYQTIKGTLTTAFIWIPLAYLWLH